jgi:XTP/dITP diphosphohydrolase
LKCKSSWSGCDSHDALLDSTTERLLDRMARTTLLIATLNPGKVREIRHFLATLPFEVTGLESIASVPPCIEDGKTFEANAIKKALYYSQFTQTITMADDSGLVVDALHGEPGLHSARYLGQAASDPERCQSILARMEDVSEPLRSARFVCSIALAKDQRMLATFSGVVEGVINHAPRGQNGFGYDPIFFIPELGKTMAELEADEKLEISHRGRALRQLAAGLKQLRMGE